MLAHLIESKGITPARLAADTGLAEPTLTRLLQGKRKFNAKLMNRLADYFQVNPELFRDA